VLGLSAHTWLIAAIFVPYVLLMTGLGWYIWLTSRPPRDGEDENGSEDEDAPLPV